MRHFKLYIAFATWLITVAGIALACRAAYKWFIS